MPWDIAGKQVLITGGNSGIGRATAVELARRGARVTITARHEGRGLAAVEAITRSSGGDIELATLDLSSLDGVRRFAEAFSGDHDHLDVLINNAGITVGRRRETIDGFEWTFAVNHLGPFLLTNLLTNRLTASPSARIITVSSDAHRSAREGLDFDDLQMTRQYSSMRAYASSKLANILFTVELDRRLSEAGVTARALHPGVVATAFGQDPESAMYLRIGMRLIRPLLKTPEQGAEMSILLATASDEELSKGIFWSEGAPAQPTAAALDSGAAARLWDVSERLVGLAT
jgi:NAD(P)-dependent dehydrogenase (short-subunit alcohol dehydrogenase family)